MDNVYDVAIADQVNKEIRQGEIVPIGRAETPEEALNTLKQVCSGVVAVEYENDPANPGETAYFAVYA